MVVNAHFATGRSDWYEREDRFLALLGGWKHGCEDAGCTWGGGESPSLPGLLDAAEIELAGCAVGAIPEGRSPILGDDLDAGDEIVIVASSGLHTNGASVARMLVDEGHLPDGYRTPIDARGTSLGEALLEPPGIYTPQVRAVLVLDLHVS